jgi:hypothetical protein
MDSPVNCPPVSEKTCDDPGCPGWVSDSETSAIQKCDACGRFSSDDEAVSYVLSLEALDTSRQVEHQYHRLYYGLKNKIEDILLHHDNQQSRTGVPLQKKFVQAEAALNAIQEAINEVVSNDIVTWQDHAYQFTVLLSTLYEHGEVSEDTETMTPEGYFSVKIHDLTNALGLPWFWVQSIFERALKMRNHIAKEESRGC